MAPSGVHDSKMSNEYLDIVDDLDSKNNENDQDSEEGYDSEAADLRRGVAKRSHLRHSSNVKLGKRKRDLEEDEEEQSDDDVDEDQLSLQEEGGFSGKSRDFAQPDGEIEEQDVLSTESRVTSRSEKSQKKKAKPGIIYLSRIPPFMKPSTLKSHLIPFGPVNRLFLTPESQSVHSHRVKHLGGNKKTRYIDGWVEFVHKSHAKLAAETLNTTIVGGKKGGWYHDDIWVVKYLRGFKWADLTEQVRNERAEREGRLREEIRRDRKEAREWVEGVQRGKMEDRMRTKRQGRGEDFDEQNKDRRQKARIRQNQVKKRAVGAGELDKQPEEIRRVLSKIF